MRARRGNSCGPGRGGVVLPEQSEIGVRYHLRINTLIWASRLLAWVGCNVPSVGEPNSTQDQRMRPMVTSGVLTVTLLVAAGTGMLNALNAKLRFRQFLIRSVRQACSACPRTPLSGRSSR